MNAELYRDQHSKAIILFKRGHKLLHCLTIAPPVRVVKIEKHEERYFAPLLRNGEPYPLKRALRRFKEAGRSLGITDGARQAIKAMREAA